MTKNHTLGVSTKGVEGKKLGILRTVSEKERLEIYDRLASKWAAKIEAKAAHRKLLMKHPGLIITSPGRASTQFGKHHEQPKQNSDNYRGAMA